MSFWSVTLTDVPESLKNIFFSASKISFVIAVVFSVVIAFLQLLIAPRKIQKIREDLVNPLAHEKTKKSVMVTLDKDLLKWLEDEIEKKEFGAISHAIEKALLKLKQDYEKRD